MVEFVAKWALPIVGICLVGISCGSGIPDDFHAELSSCVLAADLQDSDETGDSVAPPPRDDLPYYCGYVSIERCISPPSGGELSEVGGHLEIDYLGSDSDLKATSSEDCSGSFPVWAAREVDLAEAEVIFRGETISSR